MNWPVFVLVWIGALVGTDAYMSLTKQQTLSQFITHYSQTNPILASIVGVVVGGLVSHFWISEPASEWNFLLGAGAGFTAWTALKLLVLH